jgi:hypothetical protein
MSCHYARYTCGVAAHLHYPVLLKNEAGKHFLPVSDYMQRLPEMPVYPDLIHDRCSG